MPTEVEPLLESSLFDVVGTRNAAFEARPEHIALLDGLGKIIWVNAAWRRFATENSADSENFYVGANYLEICESAAWEGAEGATNVRLAILASLAGDSAEFFMKYPCHSPDERRWFNVTVTRFVDADAGDAKVIVTHENITIAKVADHPLSASRRQISRHPLKPEVQVCNDAPPSSICPLHVTRLQKYSKIAASAAVISGISVLVGWQADWPILKSVLPGFVAMNPLTAVCFIALGAGLWLHDMWDWRGRMAAVALGGIVAISSVSKLAGFATGIDYGADRFLFRDKLYDTVRNIWNTMAPNTALTFLFLSIGLACLPFPKRRRIAQTLATISLLLALSAATGYLYGVQELYRIKFLIPMALNTAAVFSILAIGFHLAHPEEGFVHVLWRSDSGGRATRMLLPIAIGLPLFLGWLRIAGQQQGFYHSDFGIALLTVSNLLVSVVIIFWVGNRLSQSDVLRSRDEQALRISERRFGDAIAHAPTGMGLMDLQGMWLQVNGSLCQMLGMSQDEMLATTFSDVTHPEDRPADNNHMRDLLEGQVDSYSLEKRCFDVSGTLVWVNVRVSMVRDEVGLPFYFICQILDITHKRAMHEELRHIARHDNLTGLANRAAFMDAVQYAMERRARRPSSAFAVLFIDLDSFKKINDSLGHFIGDELLKEVAARILHSVRPTDLVARLGGDEFTVLVDEVQEGQEAAAGIRVARRILTQLTEPFELNGNQLQTSASIGIATCTLGCRTPEDVLRDADIAMYRAKTAGKSSFAVFNQQMHDAAVKRLEMETGLRRALVHGEFVLQYQPIVRLRDRHLCGFEALVRWRHPELGMIPPDAFLPLAEEMGLIAPLGAWVLKEACHYIADVNSRRPLDERIAVNVNVSPAQLRQEFVEEVQIALTSANLDPKLLRLEITEGSVVQLCQSVDDVFARIKNLGVEFQIDDFGTGYSSLAYLYKLPVNALKIDRSFVAEMSVRKEATEIIRMILALANVLEVNVVAEGIETIDDYESLSAMGCAMGQGYYLSRPLSAEAAAAAATGAWGHPALS